MSDQLQRVWLILAEVRVVGNNPVGYKVGSRALVQCFVPHTIIERALLEVEHLLRNEGLERIDVIKCESFDGDEAEDDDAPNFVIKNVLEARRSGKPMTGTFFHGRDSASFQDEELEKLPDDDTIRVVRTRMLPWWRRIFR